MDSISRLPHDELLKYGRSLGLELTDDQSSDEVADRVRLRLELLESLDREALMDVIRWSRRPVRKEAGKEELAREISRIQKTNYDSLSTRGLITLARLREIKVLESDSSDQLIDKLRKREGFWERINRGRRRVVGSVLSRIFEGEPDSQNEAYQYLPEEIGKSTGAEKQGAAEFAKGSLRKQIEDLGVVGGLAQRLRGAADDYIRIKLDEIELRIDQKLNEIDQRLAEWRDREVANRLRILKITLGFTVVVAVLSLLYNYAKREVDSRHANPPAAVEKPQHSLTG